MYNAKRAYRADIDKLTNDFLRDFESDIQRIISEHADESEESIFDTIDNELYLRDDICDFLDVAYSYILNYGCCRDCWCETEAEGRIVYASDNFYDEINIWNGMPAMKLFYTMALSAIEADLTISIKEFIAGMVEDIKKVRQ